MGRVIWDTEIQAAHMVDTRASPSRLLRSHGLVQHTFSYYLYILTMFFR